MQAPLQIPVVPRRMAELVGRNVAFVHATVVRTQEPTSARPGDQAIVLADGTIEGFVGGHCATGSVRAAALAALESGESVLLRVLPEDAHAFPEAPGARVVRNPCLSGGAVEIFLEPVLPAPVFHVAGSSPIAAAVSGLAAQLGFAVTGDDDGPVPPGALVALVARHGGDELGGLREALAAGAAYVGLVASPKRGAALLDELLLSDADRARIRTPVGLHIGARTPMEIAVSILAEVIAAVRLDGLRAGATAAPAPSAVQVVDPVCGMTVVVGPDTPHALIAGDDFWFCCGGCRDRYAAERAGAS